MNIDVNITDNDLRLIEEMMARFNSDLSAGPFNSHGTLDLAKLTTMLLEDVALANSRPGSWEGYNMLHVLHCHGYTQ